MKKIYRFILPLLLACSCNYLDIAPDLGLDEEEVFSNYTNYMAYLNSAYTGDPLGSGTSGGTSEPYPYNLFYASLPGVMNGNSYRLTFYAMTDIADAGRLLRTQTIKGGSLGENVMIFVNWRVPIFNAMYRVIRTANKCIENIDMLQDATQEEKDDILGQAYFIRAWCHMTLCNYFGNVPYIDHALTADEESDLPGLPSFEVYKKVAEDAQMAFNYFSFAGKLRRDNGNLQDVYQNRPNGVAALALKGRALNYAASPLHNTTGDVRIWEEAARANSEALNVALQQSYELLPMDQWKTNWLGAKYTNEQLWAWNLATNSTLRGTYINNHVGFPMTNQASSAADCPTQECVDMFETADGYPLYTEEQRKIAETAGSYNEQNPYKDRDPRFYKLIVFDGCVTEKNYTVNMYYDPATRTWPSSDIGETRTFCKDWNSDTNNGFTNTGYYSAKMWDGAYYGNRLNVTDPLIRLAEVYLNYAEAANEAYGPTSGVPGQLTAEQAVNIVRTRAGMPGVRSEYTGSKEDMRDRIRNERTVELMFEGNHYYIDSRRWKVTPERMKGPLHGIHIEKTDVSKDNPNGRKYIRKELPANRQSAWKDAMYYFFLPSEEANQLANYVNNERG